MSIIDIIIVLILGYSLLAGMYKGFIASGLSLLGFVAAWFGAYFSYGTLMNFFLSNSTIMGFCSNLLEASSFFEGADAKLSVIGSAAEDLSRVTEYIAEKVPLVGTVFRDNVFTQKFAGLLFGNTQLTTMADYLDQTVWVAVFGVISFIIMFALIYVVITLFVNLLNHVISFPLLRRVDWLLGGVFGLLRGAVVALLLYVVADYLLKMFLPDNSAVTEIINSSKLLGMTRSMSFLDVKGLLNKIIAG